MFRSAESDPLGTKGLRDLRLSRLIGVCPNTKFSDFVRPLHDLRKLLVDTRLLGIQSPVNQHPNNIGGQGLQLTPDHFSGSPIHRDPIPLPKNRIPDPHFPRSIIHSQCLASHHANLAHLACHQGSMGGHPSSGSEDSLSRLHASNVFRARLDAAKDHLLSPFPPLLSVLGVKDDATGGSAWSRRQALRKNASLFRCTLLVLVIEYRLQKLVQ